MKHIIYQLFLLSAITLSFDTQRQTKEVFFNRLIDNSLILHENGMAKSDKEVKRFVSDFRKANGEVDSYKEKFSIEVNTILDYEIGEIQTEARSYSVMFLKRKDKNSGIEFLVIYENMDSEGQQADIDRRRAEWIELCNANRADELVKQLYTVDAYYYNRGRLLQGTASISQEYSYMNSPQYKLSLTPKHVTFVTKDIAYEIGRCSGSYPLPYMLLWQKDADGNWKILMDSNY